MNVFIGSIVVLGVCCYILAIISCCLLMVKSMDDRQKNIDDYYIGLNKDKWKSKNLKSKFYIALSRKQSYSEWSSFNSYVINNSQISPK